MQKYEKFNFGIILRCDFKRLFDKNMCNVILINCQDMFIIQMKYP